MANPNDYFVVKTLIIGPPQQVKQPVADRYTKDMVIKRRNQAKIIGFEIGKVGTDKTIKLTKDQACYFVAKLGGEIRNARLRISHNKDGSLRAMYLEAKDGPSLVDSEYLFRVDNEDGTMKPGYEQFATESKRTMKKQKEQQEIKDNLNKAMEILRQKGVKLEGIENF